MECDIYVNVTIWYRKAPKGKQKLSKEFLTEMKPIFDIGGPDNDTICLYKWLCIIYLSDHPPLCCQDISLPVISNSVCSACRGRNSTPWSQQCYVNNEKTVLYASWRNVLICWWIVDILWIQNSNNMETVDFGEIVICDKSQEIS